ncbi:MAG: hypothetical protein AAGM40_02855 [Cyanobacteria bacterium J06573_2]
MTKQKSNKLNWFVWFPYPSSWIKALFITIFSNVVIFIVRITLISGFRISVIINSPHILVLFGVFSLLIPIPIIACTHHLLHLFLSKYISAIQTPEMKNTKGMKIQIFSWWEGLYGWLVIVISIMIASAMSIFLLPLFDLDLSIRVAQYTSYQKQIITLFGILILVTAALLYQFEYCFKRGLLFVNSKIDKSN